MFNLSRIQTQHTPLTDDQIQALAPSVFATERHTATSDRYQFISTAAVLHGTQRVPGQAGCAPVRTAQTRVRLADRRDFTRHLLVFRQAAAALQQGEVLPEIVLVNAHDGTSSYQLHAGLFRLVCANGLIVADGMLTSIRVKHTGNVVGDVIDATYHVMSEVPTVLDAVEQWRGTQLTEAQQLAYARAALELRYDAGEAPITPAPTAWGLRCGRRYSWSNLALRSSRQQDLWTTFNVAPGTLWVHLLRGGVRGQTKTGKRMSTRAVNSVTEHVRLGYPLGEGALDVDAGDGQAGQLGIAVGPAAVRAVCGGTCHTRSL